MGLELGPPTLLALIARLVTIMVSMMMARARALTGKNTEAGLIMNQNTGKRIGPDRPIMGTSKLSLGIPMPLWQAILAYITAEDHTL